MPRSTSSDVSIVVVGDTKCGKTQLINRFAKKCFYKVKILCHLIVKFCTEKGFSSLFLTGIRDLSYFHFDNAGILKFLCIASKPEGSTVPPGNSDNGNKNKSSPTISCKSKNRLKILQKRRFKKKK